MAERSFARQQRQRDQLRGLKAPLTAFLNWATNISELPFRDLAAAEPCCSLQITVRPPSIISRNTNHSREMRVRFSLSLRSPIFAFQLCQCGVLTVTSRSSKITEEISSLVRLP